MNLDDHFRDQLSRGQPSLMALHKAAHAYAASLQCKCRTETACRPTCTCHDGYQSGGCDRCDTYGFHPMDSEIKKWHVVVDTSQQDELGNGPQGIAITPHEDDVVDAIAWMQEGTYEDAVVMAKSRETAKALTEAVELLREAIQILEAPSLWNQLARASRWSTRVRKFLEGKQ